MTAPVLVLSGTAVSSTANPISTPFPASGIQNGDIAILIVGCNSSAVDDASTDLDPAFTKFGIAGTGGTGHAVIFGWKRCDGTENGTSASVDFSSGALTKQAQILIYRGCVASGTPYEAPATNIDSVGSSSVVGPNITTLGADRRVLIFSGRRAGNAPSSLPPATWTTESYNDLSSGLDVVLLAKDVATAQTVTGPTIAYPTSSVSAASGFALIPAAGGPGNASGSIPTATASAVSGAASSARSCSVTLVNESGVPLDTVSRRFWTRKNLQDAAADGGAGGLAVTCNALGVFNLTGLTVLAGAGWLTYKDAVDDMTAHVVPVTFV